MKHNRPTLAEFSDEVLASDIQGEKLIAKKHEANSRYRSMAIAPTTDHATRIAKIAAGEDIPPVVDVATQRMNAARECRDMEDACDLHHNQSRAIRHKALKTLCTSLMPEHETILKRLAAACMEAHSANRDFQELKSYLIDQGGVLGICLTNPEAIFGQPTDRTSDFAMLLREFVSLGIINKMPEALR